MFYLTKNLLFSSFWTLLTAFGMNQTLFAQKKFDIAAQTTNSIQGYDLAKTFKHYELYRLDWSDVNRLAAQVGHFDVRIRWGKKVDWNFELTAHDIRANNFREIALTEKGPIQLKRRPCVTFRGQFKDKPDDYIRATITEDYFFGLFVKEGKTYFIEPLANMFPNASKRDYVLYQAKDVKQDAPMECGYKIIKDKNAPYRDYIQNQKQQQAQMPACMEVEIATSADFLMYQTRGNSVTAVNDFIATAINMMEPLYDDFNLDFLIVDQFVPTSAAADPITTSLEADDILNDFSTWAPANMQTHDIGQFWTARDIEGCGGAGPNLIGCAQSIGGVCGTQRYNVCEDLDNLNSRRVLSAHECGHNFDGVHSEADSLGPNEFTIMWPTIFANATQWSAGNITRIQDHIDSRDCLSNCGDLCDVDVFGALTQGESCPGFNDGEITLLASNSNGTIRYQLDKITGTPITYENTNGTFEDLEPGDYRASVYDDTYAGGSCNDSLPSIITIDPGSDPVPPTAVCYNPTIQLPAIGHYTLTWPDVLNLGASFDNCGEINLVDFSPKLVNCEDVNNPVQVTVTINDDNGNISQCIADVTVEDNIPPNPLCKDITVYLDDNGEVLITPDMVDNGSFDACGIGIMTVSPSSFNCDDTGANGITLTVTDVNGNSDHCSATVTVLDTTAPIIICPPNIDVPTEPGICGANVFFDLTVIENCPGFVIEQIGGPPGPLYPPGGNELTYQVTDASGNTGSCTFKVHVSDTEPPVIDCPADVTIENDPGLCGAVYHYDVSASDNCNVRTFEHILGRASGDFFDVGENIVRYLAIDDWGNKTLCEFKVTVLDTEAPIIECPEDITVKTDEGECTARVYYFTNESDNCGYYQTYNTLLQGPQTGNPFPLGTTLVEWMITDSAGNTGTCSFTVTVEDEGEPELDCPNHIFKENDPGACGAIVEYSLSPSDACGEPTATLIEGLPSGAEFPVGNTLVVWEVSDTDGNSSLCSFEVTIDDTEVPVFDCPGTVQEMGNPNFGGTWVDYDMSVEDNCGVEKLELLSGLPSGSFFPIGVTLVHYRATDAAGNVSDCKFFVVVLDDSLVRNNPQKDEAFNGVLLFPNPTGDVLHVKVDRLEMLPKSFMIRDVTGKTVFTADWPPNTAIHSIRLSDYLNSSGVYQLILIRDDAIRASMFVYSQ